MAVIKKKISSLHALSAAALSLPGMLSQPILAAEGDEVDFQYSHYQEGKRDISVLTSGSNTGNSFVKGSKSSNPIEVEGLHGSAKISLTDRVKFAFNYSQDTWGGATPLASVPFLATGNNGYTVDNVTGATPYATAGAALNTLTVDSRLKAMFASDKLDPNTSLPIYKNDTKLTHIMATASPETRKQGDFKLSHEWDNAEFSAGGGISVEDDYESRFGNLGARFDFNQKQTTLNIGLSYTNSYTKAVLDHDDYTLKELVPDNQLTQIKAENGTIVEKIIHGTRQDWATHLGLTQVINKDAYASADFSYTRSTGYLSNPYKGVAIAFADFNFDPDQLFTPLPPGIFPAPISIFTEKRPEVRNQYGLGGRFVQYVNPLNATLHFDYHFSADDWAIQSHTFDADWVQPLGDGWTVTPRIRYYSQDAASFYTPYVITNQAYEPNLVDSSGREVFYDLLTNDKSVHYFKGAKEGEWVDAQGNSVTEAVNNSQILPQHAKTTYDRNKLPAYYSSDHRLSGFGSLSGGVTIAKQFAKGLTLETGFEYYTHQGALKIGGGGEGSYANFDYWVANAALKVNLDALSFGNGGFQGGHEGHATHHHAAHEPAGVMFGHMLSKSGDFMAGYRFMWNSQGGGMLGGSDPVPDSSVIANGCPQPSSGCFLTPTSMSMSMHMLDLMYAPTDWLTLMLMPQFVDMDMDMRALDGLKASDAAQAAGSSDIGGHFTHHTQNSHETGGIGDLGVYALFKVFDQGSHRLHATAGLSAPTGDVNIQFRRAHKLNGGFMDYGMQLGSGTWDFKPSLTYTGQIDDWSWGAQTSGTVRMEDKNRSGYRLGDLFQATAWGGYNLTNWLTASVRGVYTLQGRIEGQFPKSSGQFTDPEGPVDGESQINRGGILKFGPNDYPQNYGGQFWDVGFGLSAMVPSGDFAGNKVSVEWLQPVHTDFNGYQLDRDGALSATWSMMF